MLPTMKGAEGNALSLFHDALRERVHKVVACAGSRDHCSASKFRLQEGNDACYTSTTT